MLPSQLTAESFAKYPPEARQLATEHVALPCRLPLDFLPLLLRRLRLVFLPLLPCRLPLAFLPLLLGRLRLVFLPLLLRRLPLAFLPLLLRELIVYDWKFPAERIELTRQFRYLGALADAPFQIPTLGAYFEWDARFSSGKPVVEVA